MKTKAPFIPREEYSTVRRAILSILAVHTLSARELSAEVRVPEKEVVEHLEHIRTACHHGSRPLQVVPAVCKKCGFIFRKRERLARPGRCPLCRNEQIAEPLYTLG